MHSLGPDFLPPFSFFVRLPAVQVLIPQLLTSRSRGQIRKAEGSDRLRKGTSGVLDKDLQEENQKICFGLKH